MERSLVERVPPRSRGGAMKGPPVAALTAWASEMLGRNVRLDLSPGGGSRTSFVVRVADGGKYILLLDNGDGPLSGTGFTL